MRSAPRDARVSLRARPAATRVADGTVDAAVFLARRVAAADARTSYTMIDVLRAGAMD